MSEKASRNRDDSRRRHSHSAGKTSAPVEDTTVEVAIPTWNRADTLIASVTSALNQDVPVVVHVYDNGSDDDTVERLQTLHDDRLVIHRWEENRGRFENMSRALRSGSSAYLLFLFDDEILLPGSIRALLEVANADPTLAFVHGDVIVRDTGGKTLRTGLYGGVTAPPRLEGKEFVRRSFRHGCYVWINSVLFRRSMIKDIQFDPRDSPLDDVGVMLRAATRGGVGYVQRPVSTRTDGNHGEAVREGLLVAGPAGSDVYSLGGSILMQRPFERFLLQRHDFFAPEERASLLRRVRYNTAWQLGKAAAVRVREKPFLTLTGRDPSFREIVAWAGGLRAKCQLVRSIAHHLVHRGFA